MKRRKKKSKKPIAQRAKAGVFSVYESLQVEAIYNAVTNNDGFFERKVRRWFSKNYNTPLMDTYEVPWSDILIHYYESLLENNTFNQNFEIMTARYLPELVDQKDAEDAAFAQSLVEEQRRTLKKKKAKTKVKLKKPAEAPKRKPEGEPEEVMNLQFDDKDFEGGGDEDS